MLCAGCLGW